MPLPALLIFATLILSQAGSASAEKRVALVIGNSAYQHTSALANPKHDAADITAALKKIGFQVLEGLDLDKTAMDRTIRQFARELNSAHVGLFFYAGHGLQVEGQNYLVPVDAKLEDASGLDFETVRMDLVHKTMERATKTNLIFLDACRDNPLSRNLARALGTRSTSVGKGLAAIESGEGTLLSFSTQPGNLAADGTGRNSPYASALLKHLVDPRDDISTMLIGVRNQVIQETARRQVPWEHSALTARFYFRAPEAQLAAESSKPTPLALPSYEQQAELALWSAVKDSKNPAMVQNYLDRFPRGTFAGVASILVEQLRQERDQTAAVATKDGELKKAEEAKQIAEQQRVDAERKAAAARQSDELRQAQEEVKKAREALAAAEHERLVALKAAEGARKAQDEARKTAEAVAQAKLAAVPGPWISGPDREKLARDLQRELKRVGCDSGTPDGKWGARARSALTEYSKRTKVALGTDEPSPAALDAVTGQKGRVCPLDCGDNEVERGGRCVTKPRSRTVDTAPAKVEPARQRKEPGMCFSTAAMGSSGRVGSLVPCDSPNAAK